MIETFIKDILPREQVISDGVKNVIKVPFSIISPEFISVYYGENKISSGISPNLYTNEITLSSVPSKGTLITIVRAVPVDWNNADQGGMNKDAFNQIYSLLVSKMQTLQEELNRCVKTPIYSDKSGEHLSEFFLQQMTDALDILSRSQDSLALIQTTSESALANLNSALDSALAQIKVQVSNSKTYADNAQASADRAKNTVDNAIGNINQARDEALAELKPEKYYTKIEANGTFVGLKGNQSIDGTKTFLQDVSLKTPTDSSNTKSAINIEWHNNHVDAELSLTSTNPVRNSTVKKALDGKQASGDYATNTTVNTKQDKSNLSQTLDASTTKYPSNKAVKDAIDAKDSLPTQTGNNGKFLQTDGTSAKWSTVDLSSKADNNSVVHLAGNETITGNKTISNPINLANWNMPRSIGIGNNVTYSDIFNARFGQAVFTQMRVGNKGKLGQISISADDSGNITTHCPSPRDGGGDTQIANIGWVNTKLESISGSIDQNTGKPLYDWVGTLKKYTDDNIAITHPDWLCYITDDLTEDPTELNGKANIDLDNITQAGKDVIDTQIDTKLNTLPKQKVVSVAPAQPEANTFYFITE